LEDPAAGDPAGGDVGATGDGTDARGPLPAASAIGGSEAAREKEGTTR
jgi:hypothetical protein